MRWQPTAMPRSAADLLHNARGRRRGPGGEFSRTQEFVAALYWFTTFPLEMRLEMVREFGNHHAMKDDTKT
jgi:hypothetical protein